MKIEIDSNILRALLRNVYFLNGTACAGKSTMVKLLAEKYDGICCGENYHDEFMDLADPVHQPHLCYFQTMSGWQEFVTRSPEEYDAWIVGCAREAAQLELIKLIRLSETGRKIFVDTNISPAILAQISDYHRVVMMLSPQWMSVSRFFDRPDPEKQFLYRKLQECPHPESALANYRRCLEKINSAEHFQEFSESGFYCILRQEDSTIEDTLQQLEEHFLLV